MSSQLNIKDELKSLQSGLPITDNAAFSVPDGYFEGLASSILAKVKAREASSQNELTEISPLLAGISKVTPYAVPKFYFEENASLIPDYSAEPELYSLNGVSKVAPYKIPQGYFDTLPELILSKVARPTAKVVPLFARKWMRMAAAAVIGGALFVGAYQYFNGKPLTDLAGNSNDTTQNSVALNAPAIEQEIKKTSTQELTEFVKNVAINGKAQKVETTSADDDKVKKFLKDISDTEIETFLSVLPTADDELPATD